MGNIDKAVEISTSRAFDSAFEGPQPEREETCIVCGKVGALTDMGWVENWYVERNSEETWIDGDALRDAAETPWGFACCKRCASQAMYDHSDDKRALDAVVDACRAIVEYGSRARDTVNKMESHVMGDALEDAAKQFLADVHDEGRDMPPWLNR
jgi:hypothetical protein